MRPSKWTVLLIALAALVLHAGASDAAIAGAISPASSAVKEETRASLSEICDSTVFQSTIVTDSPAVQTQNQTQNQTLEDPLLRNSSSPSDQGTQRAELPVKYWGNSFSGKFHRPSCAFAKAMNARHVVLFHFRREAIECGQQPCRYCLPPFIKRVECKLLPRAALDSTTEASHDHQPGIADVLPRSEL